MNWVMFITAGFLAGLGLATTVFGALAYREAKRNRENGSFPYWLRNGIEDVTAQNVDVLARVKAYLEFVELRMEQQNEYLGQIRNGNYDKNRPAGKR